MPKVNCLESARKAYGETLDNQDIVDVYTQLENHKKMAENAGANVFEELNSFSKELGEEQERAAKIALFNQILKGQVLADNLQREQLFREARHTPQNSVPRSLFSKMVGSTFKVARGKEHTYGKQQAAVDKFTSSFANDLQSDLLPYFTSKTGQKELAQAMFDLRDGKVSDSPYSRLAQIFDKYQDQAFNKNKEVGVFINRLENRISPNIHDPEKILSLSSKERKQAANLYPDAGDSAYEFAYQRWSQDIRPSLDEDSTFRRNNVDPSDPKQVDAFMRHGFDNVVNKGKSSQNNVNYANKFKQQRVFNWKDADGLVDYNNKYGSGSLQDSMFKELQYQFGMIEVMRDWTTDPIGVLDATLELFDKNPKTVQRINKGNEYKKLRDTLKSMTSREYTDYGAISTIMNGLKTYEAASKLGLATLTSVDDLANTSRVAKQLGYSKFSAYGGVIKRFALGLSKEEKELYGGLVNTGLATKLSQMNRFNMNPYAPRSVLGMANHWIYKLNLLERWDNANKGYVTSIVGKFLSENRKTSWEAMTQHDKDIFESYSINKSDWDLIRQSKRRLSAGEEFIMPDTIQDLSDDKVAAALTDQGANPTALRIQSHKDMLERKLTSFFRDRTSSAIVSPDIVDRNMLTFENNGTRRGAVIHHAVSWATQFKHYGVAWVRKSLLPVLRENGAVNSYEYFNPLAGKSNWKGMGAFAAERMFLAYIGLTMKNLVQGKSNPDLDKADTWKSMAKQTIGPLELAFNVNASDIPRSVGTFALGPIGTDLVKLLNIGRKAASETKEGMGYDKTKKATYQFIKNGIPFNTLMTKWLVNHFWLDGMEDEAYPGKRQQDLQQLQQNTGARQIF